MFITQLSRAQIWFPDTNYFYTELCNQYAFDKKFISYVTIICSKHYLHPNNKYINYSKHIDTLKVEFHIFLPLLYYKDI